MNHGSGRQGGSAFASFLVLVGTLSVLGVTFGSGVLVGRYLQATSRVTERIRDDASRAPRPPARPRAAAAPPTDRDTAASDTAPTLSFYHDLTAPVAPGTAMPASIETPLPAAGAGESFTVQVAAYTAASAADALRAKLAARGIDADVAPATTAAGTRYRVRVGTYPTRAAADEAAVRIAAETRLGTIVVRR